jgi:hypothetical protein
VPSLAVISYQIHFSNYVRILMRFPVTHSMFTVFAICWHLFTIIESISRTGTMICHLTCIYTNSTSVANDTQKKILSQFIVFE